MSETTLSEPGGLPFLFLGQQVSSASLWIKVGRNFEKWFKYVVEDNGMELLPDGVIKNVIDSKSKDIDLLFKDNNNTVYYRELKSNINLDTEKLLVTCQKVKKINQYLQNTYPTCKVDIGVLTWSVFELDDLNQKSISKYNKFKGNGVKVYFPSDLFKTINVQISKNDYYTMFKNLKKKYL